MSTEGHEDAKGNQMRLFVWTRDIHPKWPYTAAARLMAYLPCAAGHMQFN